MAERGRTEERSRIKERERGETPELPALGGLGWARWAWRQLTSMRTALFLLLLLALGAVPGSMFPQRGVDPTRVNEYLTEHTQAGPWLDRLGFFDVYSSVWFSAIYLLLFISLVGCVVPRTRVHLKSIRAQPPRTPARLDRLPAYQSAQTDAEPRQVLDAAAAILRKRRYRVDVRDGSVAAESGYLRETGNLLFHIALLGLLGAVAAGSLLSYRGQVIIVQGQGFANAVSQYDTISAGAWVNTDRLDPFRITLDDVDARFETKGKGSQFAAARDFTAHVTVVDEPGATARQDTIKVNHPLQVGGASIYLQGNGYAPVLTVRDAGGQVISSGPVVFLAQDGMYTSTGVVKVPDTTPQLGLQGVFLPSMAVKGDDVVSVFPEQLDPRLLFTVWTGDLGLTARPQSVYQLDTTELTELKDAEGKPYTVMLAPGESIDLPDGLGSVTFERVDRFAALQTRTDPAKGWALGFAALAMIGVAASLFISRRRVWVRTVRRDGRMVIEVAALARGDDPRLDREIADLLARLPTVDDGEQNPTSPESEGTGVRGAAVTRTTEEA